jgi:hypothetical protein
MLISCMTWTSNGLLLIPVLVYASSTWLPWIESPSDTLGTGPRLAAADSRTETGLERGGPTPNTVRAGTGLRVALAGAADLAGEAGEVAAHERVDGGQAGAGEGRGVLADGPERRGDVFPREVLEELEVTDADDRDDDGAGVLLTK